MDKLGESKLLKRTTLVEQLADRLSTYIDTNKLPADHALSSTQRLSAEYGVSRAVVREALKLLQARGIIEVRNGKNAAVRSITIEPLVGFFERIRKLEDGSFREFMEVRRGLETQSAGLAAVRRTREEMETIRWVCAAMRQHLYDAEKFSQLDLDFHLLIARATHNKMMVRLIQSVREVIKQTIDTRVVHLLESQGKLQEQGQKLHELLVHSLERGDRKGAERAMRRHFDEFAFLALLGGKANKEPAGRNSD
jgi:GntR family transcriptional repressor for pyruvate dehydrogenase complex